MVFSARAVERIQMFGVQKNASGVFRMLADNQPLQEPNLWLEGIECNLLADWDLSSGSHTLTLTLLGLDPF